MKIVKLFIALAIFTGTTTTLKPKAAIAAEKISFPLSVFGEFEILVEDLAIFAESGTITSEFAYYTNRLDKKTLQQLRQILQTSFTVEPITSLFVDDYFPW